MGGVIFPLSLTLAVQGVIAFAMVAIPILLPAFGPAIGLSAAFAGTVIAIIYAGAMITSYFCSALVQRAGGIRSCQASLVLVSLGVLLCAHGHVMTLVIGALAIGLGYGPITSAATLLLTRSTPPASFGLVFSINRVSVPAGAALAGLTLPALSQRMGWQCALAALAAIVLVLALLLQPARPLDHVTQPADSAQKPAVRSGSIWTPLKLLLQHPRRRLLAKTALVFLAAQSCLAGFTVAFLVDVMSRPFVEAGAILATAQFAGVVARLGLGFAFDRIVNRMALMGCIGLLIAVSASLAAMAQPHWPRETLFLIFALFGAGALGWNGVMLAELAHSAKLERAGEIAGAFSAVTFAGAAFGPMLFSALLPVIGYAGGFMLLAVTSLLAGIALIRSTRQLAPAST